MQQTKNSPLSFILKNCQPFKLFISLHLFVILFNAIDLSLWSYVSKLLIDTVGAASRENVIAEASGIAAIFIAITFLPGFVWRISDYSWMNMTPALKKKITVESTNYIMRHSSNFFQNNFTGALANRVKDLTTCTPHLIEIALYQFLGVFLSLIIAFFTLLTIHKFFAFGILIWAILFMFMGVKAAKLQEKMSADISNQSSKIMGNIVDVLGNIANVKFFANHAAEQRRIAQTADEYTVFSKRRNMFLLKFFLIHGISFSLYFAFCIVILIYLYAQSKVTIGDFAMIFTINTWMIHAMWTAANEMRGFLEEWGTVKQALQIINEPIEIEDAPNAQSLIITSNNSKASSQNGGEIIFENVDFSYKVKAPLNDVKVLDWSLIGLAAGGSAIGFEEDLANFDEDTDRPKNVFSFSKNNEEKTFFHHQNITIKAGQKVGLVGHSGSGKSTFVNLILRQFDVCSGRILIDGQDIVQVTQESLRTAIGVIPQDPSLFHRSLRDNIAYAKSGGSVSDAEIIAAAKKAHAHEFITKLPQGYDSLVGERGVKLSGGQRQRIAIARAFLKNAPILILDEATSQLDSITENLIQESLINLIQNKTAIIIAHRLSTLQHVDRILVFDDGEIVEDGSHLELLALEGVYKKLWDAQVGGFLVE